MRKKLLSALTASLILGFSSMAFAAVSPFSYVPTDSWTYTAVSKLAANKIIENYSDNKVMTRFEMTQLVASAQTRTDIADAENKAIIAKLSTEFSEELKMLGNLPKINAQPNAKSKPQYGNIKASGMIDFGVGYTRAFDAKYNGNRFPGGPAAANTAMNNLMGDPQRTMFHQNFAFGLESQLSDKLSYFTLLNSDAGNKAIPIDIGWKVNFLKYKDGNTIWEIGRMGGLPWEPFGIYGQGSLRNITANDDGIGVQFGDKKTAIYQLQYVKKGTAVGPLMTKVADAKVMVTPQLQMSLAGVSDGHFYNTLAVGANYSGKGYNVVGEYGKNTAPINKQGIAGTPIKYYGDAYNDPYGWFLEVNAGNLNIFKEGTKKYALRYKSNQPGFDVAGYGGSAVTEYFGSNGSAKNQSDWKGVEFRYNYMIKKQLQYALTVSKTTSFLGTENKDWASSFVSYFF